PAWVVLLIAYVAMGLSYYLSRYHFDAAAWVFVGGMIAAVAVSMRLFESTTVAYLFPMAVYAAGVSTRFRAPFYAAVLATGAILTVSLTSPFGIGRLWVSVPAIILVYFAAIASWLVMHRFQTALAWALNTSDLAMRRAQEAQEHRGRLRRALKDLDEAYRRLDHADQALARAWEIAEDARRFKSQFAANLSHELRTPLNLIVGFSEMMATAPEIYGETPLPPPYRGDINAIYRSAQHLASLIDDVLDLSKIESGRMGLDREPTDPASIIHEAMNIIKGLAEVKGLRLSVDVPARLPILRVDRTRIRQVLLNLLSNAVRFTEQGGIRVCARLQDHELVISVADSGPGIPAEELPRVFEPFHQLDGSLSRPYGGAGLGLSISKQFVELHGGRMWVESEVGRGTTVSFTLPLPEADFVKRISPVEMSAPPVRASSVEPSLLVFHEDESVARLLRRYLNGYEIIWVNDVVEAIEKAGTLRPVAMITDGDGKAQWQSMIRNGDQVAEIPVLICPLPGGRRLGMALGACDYLVKPVNRKTLLRAIERLDRQPKTILIVDDDPHVARLLARMLRSASRSYTILEANSGQRALELMRNRDIDLVLLDLYMPDLSGFSLLDVMRSDPRLAKSDVIVISVRGRDETLIPLAGDLGVTKSKGLTVTEVLRLLQALVDALSPSRKKGPATDVAPAAVPTG
ncbi:MAG TPA: response regulator, partial [Anaerolineae bacterium]|nr:response regulator [Anaerolineae bacterium]